MNRQETDSKRGHEIKTANHKTVCVCTVGGKKARMGQTCKNWFHLQRTLGQIHKEPGSPAAPGRETEARQCWEGYFLMEMLLYLLNLDHMNILSIPKN